MIENLRTKLLAERRRNLVQEMEIRKEMGDAMLQQLMESEELRRWVIFRQLVMQICGIVCLQFWVLMKPNLVSNVWLKCLVGR